MISRAEAISKYRHSVDEAILEAFLSSYGELINAKELDEQLGYLVIPSAPQPVSPTSSTICNKSFPGIELVFSRPVHANFEYTNKFPGRVVAVFADTPSRELCQILAPTRSFPVKLEFGQVAKFRLTFRTDASIGFATVVEVFVRDAFTGRLLERLHFPVTVK